ncbi:MAG: 7-cyano-7-deazaguanine synthase QueC [Deferribacteraceae bacterium]|jgi:7-cyano-7-deazaguanine synthase|nr:7-cyano-7-deazaguanine synthase QueC [Deferribacteraceae bacterium]
MKPAVILLSGGMDSCVAAALAVQAGYELALLHINYGQRTQNRELSAFNDIAGYYGVKNRLIADIAYLKEIGCSSLTDHSISVRDGGVNKESVPSTYVPFRNGNMLSIAVSWAEVIGSGKVYIGAVEGDSSGYPDCTKVFYEKFNALLSVGLPAGKTISVETPLIDMKKSEIARLGIELKAPLMLTWSCYQSESIACGVCDSCRLRLKAFCDINETDPIRYI